MRVRANVINSPTMLARDLLRDDPEKVRQGLLNRNMDPAPLDDWLRLDAERRTDLVEVEDLKRQRNEASQAIGQVKQQGGDASEEIAAVGRLKSRIEELEARLQAIDPELAAIEQTLPNLPHESVPVGKDETANRVERTVGDPAPIRLSSPRPTGTSARSWASSTSSAAPRSPAPASPSNSAPAPASNGP